VNTRLTIFALAALLLIGTACATTRAVRGPTEGPQRPETVAEQTPADEVEAEPNPEESEEPDPVSIEVSPGVFIPGRMGYTVLLKDCGDEYLNSTAVPFHRVSPDKLNELKSSLFNAACYATPEGTWPWEKLCEDSFLSCEGTLRESFDELQQPYDPLLFAFCNGYVARAAEKRVVLQGHWEPVQLIDNECMLPCACEGGKATYDKSQPDLYRFTGDGCVNAYTCSFVCPGDAAVTKITASTP